MSDAKLAFTSLIDTELWDNSKWRGVILGYDQSGKGPPFMGVLFGNAEAGREIFNDWRHRFGNVDEFDEIRIAIVEGDIPGKDAGYSIAIGSDIDGIVSRAKQENHQFDPRYVATISRIHRVNPTASSTALPDFKRAYAQHARYMLLPAYGDPARPEMDWDCWIGKVKLELRRSDEIGPKDRDCSILK